MKISTHLLTGFLLFFSTRSATFAQTATQTELGQVSTFGELVSLAWGYGSKVMIVLAIFFVVLGACFYIASAGDEERVTEGKQMIFGSLVALLIVMLSGVLIRVLHQPAANTAGTLAEVPGVIGNATAILVSLIGGFSLIALLYSALLYFTAQGHPQKIDKAHSALKYAIYGVLVGSLAYAIVNAVVKWII